MRKKMAATKKPKPRHVWTINPKTQVEKNKKTYSRSDEHKKLHKIIKKIDWFGEET